MRHAMPTTRGSMKIAAPRRPRHFREETGAFVAAVERVLPAWAGMASRDGEQAWREQFEFHGRISVVLGGRSSRLDEL